MDASTTSRPFTPALRPGIAERLWDASRVEFSQRGYHGARVQGIARRAGCNVALLYRHWASKKALYLEVLRSSWTGILHEALTRIRGGAGAPAVVAAYLEANMRDPIAAQIVIREFLDGSPFLNQLLTSEPALVQPMRRTAEAVASRDGEHAFRDGVDPMLAVLTIGGLSALVASAHEGTRLFFPEPLPADAWKRHIHDLLLNGILACPPVGGGAP